MRKAEKAGLPTTMPDSAFEEMLNPIKDSLSDLASSDYVEDGLDEDDDEVDPGVGKLSKDDKPSWVMGTISNMVQHRKNHFQQKQMKLDKLRQPGWGDAANYVSERDKLYRMTELNVLAVIPPQTADHAASSAPTTFMEPIETLHSVP